MTREYMADMAGEDKREEEEEEEGRDATCIHLPNPRPRMSFATSEARE